MTVDYDWNEEGELCINGVAIPDNELSEMILKHLDGRCPVCWNGMPSDGRVICDDCKGEDR
jgi:hypothetical protein